MIIGWGWVAGWKIKPIKFNSHSKIIENRHRNPWQTQLFLGGVILIITLPFIHVHVLLVSLFKRSGLNNFHLYYYCTYMYYKKAFQHFFSQMNNNAASNFRFELKQ